MVIIKPWDGRSHHMKSDLVRGNRLDETPYLNLGTFSHGDMGPWVRMLNYDQISALLTRNELARVHNNCVDKIIEQAQVVENYFEAIYERQEALRLAATAARKLLDFILNFKKPQYWKSITKTSPKDLPEAWLTYNFGIAPLVATIDSAMKLLGKDYPTIVLRGASSSPVSTRFKIGNVLENTQHFASGTYIKEIRAHVAPKSNPNFALANVVGLTTPFSTAFSVVPWGWAVDYFVNASRLLSNFEDRFPGIYFKGIWESVLCNVTYGSLFTKYDAKSKSNYGHAHYMHRRTTSLKYQLEFSFPLLGGSQFANLASAIAVTLKGLKK